MINKRLVWYIEKNNILQEEQCGLRHGRSTTDHIVNLTNEFQEAVKNRQHLIAVFFDLEKAYDTTWRHHILDFPRRHTQCYAFLIAINKITVIIPKPTRKELFADDKPLSIIYTIRQPNLDSNYLKLRPK